MKKLAALLSFFITICFITIPAHADCREYYSRSERVVCVDVVTKGCDGTSLSSKCKSKGCNKCESSVSALALNKNSKLVSEDKTYESNKNFRCNGHVKYGIPGLESQFLCREGYAVGYDYDRKIPTWVAYCLTPDNVNKNFKRSNKFESDVEIPVKYRSTLSDYKGSGYDRGHMAASATVDSSYNAMVESFLLSNITPQLPGLNRQGWRYLESYIREWTNERKKLYVVTGVLFEGAHGVIGNGLHVPTHFYKVVFDSAGMDTIAFIIPHRVIPKSELPAFIVSVDEVELRSGLDFNNLLDDPLEDYIEADVESMW